MVSKHSDHCLATGFNYSTSLHQWVDKKNEFHHLGMIDIPSIVVLGMISSWLRHMIHVLGRAAVGIHMEP